MSKGPGFLETDHLARASGSLVRPRKLKRQSDGRRVTGCPESTMSPGGGSFSPASGGGQGQRKACNMLPPESAGFSVPERRTQSHMHWTKGVKTCWYPPPEHPQVCSVLAPATGLSLGIGKAFTIKCRTLVCSPGACGR